MSPLPHRLRAPIAIALGSLLSIQSTHATGVISLATLDGRNGFRLDGAAAEDQSGRNLSAAGDVNGDGVDDLIIGAAYADPSGADSGSSYVVFGRRADVFPSRIGLSSLDGITGFRLDGVAAGDQSGIDVSAAGDINGDGIGDLIIGAPGTDSKGERTGSSYILFGRSSGGFSPVIDLSSLDGNSGFRLDGVEAGDGVGFSASAAGDVNSDGLDDLIVGGGGADVYGDNSGSSFVFFGRRGVDFDAVINLSSLDGTTGFRLDGVAPGDFTGHDVAFAGDINSDGIDDMVIGAVTARPNGVSSGSAYVVFGRGAGDFPPVLALPSLDGSTGFRLDGAAAGDLSGADVSSAGDVNGDGEDDLIIGAVGAPNGQLSGSSYVVYGRSAESFSSIINLSSLGGNTGFRLDAAEPFSRSGYAVSAAGDINGDGVGDLIIGAKNTHSNGFNAGSSFVVFGARERIFRDGVEEQNVEVLFPRLLVRNSTRRGAVRWESGATCNCDFAPFDFGLSGLGDNLSFLWPEVIGPSGGVAVGTAYSVLQPGASIGPESWFTDEQSVASTANWRSGVDGYLGFRFVNANGNLNYGYAKIRTTAPTGYPVEVEEFGVNLTGSAVTIPAK